MPNASTSRIHALKVAVADGLAARTNLTGVQVTSAYVGDESSGVESIQLIGNDQIVQDWAAIGRLSRDEEITLSCMVQVYTPGAGDTVARASRSRAQALLAEVEEFIVADPTIGNVVLTSKIRPTELIEGFDTQGRWTLLHFEIWAKSRLTTS